MVVYFSFHNKSLLTFNFDLADAKVTETLRQARDDVQQSAVSSSKMETAQTELFQDTSLCAITFLSQARSLNCCSAAETPAFGPPAGRSMKTEELLGPSSFEMQVDVIQALFNKSTGAVKAENS